MEEIQTIKMHYIVYIKEVDAHISSDSSLKVNIDGPISKRQLWDRPVKRPICIADKIDNGANYHRPGGGECDGQLQV